MHLFHRAGLVAASLILLFSTGLLAGCKQATSSTSSGDVIAASYLIDSFESVDSSVTTAYDNTFLGSSTSLKWARLWGQAAATTAATPTTDWSTAGSKSLGLNIDFVADADKTVTDGVNHVSIGSQNWDSSNGIYSSDLKAHTKYVKKLAFDYKWVPDTTAATAAANQTVKVSFTASNVTQSWGYNIDSRAVSEALSAGTGTSTITLTFVNNNDNDSTVETPAGGLVADMRAAQIFLQVNYGGDVGTTAVPGADIADAGKTLKGKFYIDNLRYLTATTETLNPPTYSPTVASVATSTLTTEDKVTLASDNTAATIYYTVDGTDPTTTSTKYTAPFVLVAGTVTVKAIAVASGYTTSGVSSATYTVVSAIPDPTVGSASGSSLMSYSPVSLASTVYGASIYYTTDGTEPTSSSNLYAGAFAFDDVTSGSTTRTLKFFAKKGALVSATITATYSVTYGVKVAITGFDFETTTSFIASYSGSALSVVTDTDTNKTQVLTFTSTGNYEKYNYTYAENRYAGGITKMTFDMKLVAASGESYPGVVIILEDVNGNRQAAWVGDTTGVWGSHTLTLSGGAFSGGWTDSGSTLDMNNIVKVVITTNEHSETGYIDNIAFN